MKRCLPEDLIYRINAFDYEAYFVGGCVRDFILHRKTHDIDINTNMPVLKMARLFEAYNPQVFEKFGSISFSYEQFQVQITQFRQEIGYEDNRHPSKVSFVKDVRLDLQRRDFTINGILMHPDEGILDYVGGIKDLKGKTIRTIKNPEISFNEDYLRMLRAFRFESELGFSFEKQTKASLIKNYNLIRKLQWSQIYPEFKKILCSDGFVELALCQPMVLTEIIPELNQALTFDQNNPYHKYNLYEHTIHVVDHLDDYKNRLVGLFHDLGKLYTQIKKDDGTFGYPNHSEESVKIAEKYVLENRDYVFKLIELHDLSIPVSYYSIKRLVSKYGISFVRNLIKFKRADNLAKSDKALYQIDKCDQFDLYLDRIEREKPVLSIKELDIRGDELGVLPSQRLIVLNRLLDLVMQNKLENSKDKLKKEVASWDL